MMVRAVTGAQRWQKVGELFDRALGLPESDRDAFLVSECGEDAALLAQVRELLAAHSDPGVVDRLSDRIASDMNAALPQSDSAGRAPNLGEQIGPYRVLARLGSGGMGVVYLAAREGEGFHQRVAIKVLHNSMLADARGLMPRFLSERGILALLEHPNIPRFLDGGLTREGAPYIAMEYVEGTPIDKYCDEHRLSTRQRLSLFAAVCDAMQYAHQHLVVHRDLKPSNILVTQGGIPKVLDFGIAKILDVTGGAAVSQTDAGQRWMTPDYASPEQVRGDAVTTAADVFALGVLLYEMISCARPHDGKSRYELERAILETDPKRPSEALCSEKCIAKGENPAKLRRELIGDLDVIALKTLAKAPERRYRTAGDLGDDIRRYLAGFPVHARADTFLYRTGKFVRRHRMLVAALAVAAASLTLGFIGTAISYRRAMESASQAALERDRAEEVSKFAVGLFANSDPMRTGRSDITASTLLDSGAARLRRELSSQPERRAALLEVLAQSYNGLGRFEDAHTTMAEAVRLRRLAVPRRPSELANALEQHANFFIARQQPEAAMHAAREALALRRVAGDSGEPVARSYELIGTYFHMLGQADSAEHYLRTAIAIWEDQPDSSRAVMWSNLAMFAARRGNWAEAESLQMHVRDVLRASNPEGSHEIAMVLGGLSFTRTRMGKIAEARASQLEGLRMLERIVGQKHFDVALATAVIGNLWVREGQLDSAVVWANRAAALQLELFGPTHQQYIRTVLELGTVRRRQGDLLAADTLVSRALAVRRAVHGERHPDVADAQLELAAVRIAQQRYSDARSLISRARQTLSMDARRAPRLAKADSLAAQLPGNRE